MSCFYIFKSSCSVFSQLIQSLSLLYEKNHNLKQNKNFFSEKHQPSERYFFLFSNNFSQDNNSFRKTSEAFNICFISLLRQTKNIDFFNCKKFVIVIKKIKKRKFFSKYLKFINKFSNIFSALFHQKLSNAYL